MRIDKYLALHFSETYPSRTKAAQGVKEGEVFLSDKRIDDPSYEVKEGACITLLQREERFVSNGGTKLARALKNFCVSVQGKTFADIGASTGGFTDCLLQNGVKKVYAVDVGESLLDRKIASDPRVVVMDNVNARYLKKEDFPETIEGIVIDVSFISLKLILPVLDAILDKNGEIFALIKPQFECENKRLLSKNGLLLDGKVRRKIVGNIYDACLENGLYPVDIVNAPRREKKNIEYVIYLKKNKERLADKNGILAKSDELV